MERRGSLRSGEMSQGSCKAGRGWDAQTAGDRLRGSSSVASRDRRSGRASHGRRLELLGLLLFAGPKLQVAAREQHGMHWTDTGQTDSSWGAEQAAKQQRHPEALEGWHRERRGAMPKRTGAMLETQTTPEPSAAKASLMDGVRTTCRPTRPLLRARKKMSVVRSPLPESWSSPSRCQWSCCWASRRRVPPPVPVPLCQCVRCAHCKMTVRCPRRLWLCRLCKPAPPTAPAAVECSHEDPAEVQSSPVLHHDAQARLFVRCTGLPCWPPPPPPLLHRTSAPKNLRRTVLRTACSH